MSTPLLVAKGRNGSVELHQNALVVKNVYNKVHRLTGGERRINLAKVNSLNFKKAHWWAWGFLQIDCEGAELDQGSAASAPSDGYTVVFGRKHQAAFEKMLQAIEQARSSKPQPNAASSLDDLERLAALRDKGIITEAEFDAKKAQMLSL